MRKQALGESHLDMAMAFMLKPCSHGLPTRSRTVSEFMIGLEKTKARAGEVSQSARALSLEDMHRLHDFCFDPKLTDAQKRWGAIRYVSCKYFALYMPLTTCEACLFVGIPHDPSH
jgi:hypothetical protein